MRVTEKSVIAETKTGNRKPKLWPPARPETPRSPSQPSHPRIWRFQKARTLLPKKGPGEERPNSGMEADWLAMLQGLGAAGCAATGIIRRRPARRRARAPGRA